MRRFLVADVVPEHEADRVWPWLRLAPRPWRGAAFRLARPKAYPALMTEDGAVAGHAVALPTRYPVDRAAITLNRYFTELGPMAHGWLAAGPPPSMPGVTWRTGRLFALLAALSPFIMPRSPFGNPARLGVLLIGDNQPEVAVAARFLACRVRHLVLACPAENFRNRLAYQILAESGLAILTRADPPDGGWEAAIDFRRFPPDLVLKAGRGLYPRPLFPKPLRRPDATSPILMNGHPVWAECHFLCLVPPDWPPLPAEPSVGALQSMAMLAGMVGLDFTFA